MSTLTTQEAPRRNILELYPTGTREGHFAPFLMSPGSWVLSAPEEIILDLDSFLKNKNKCTPDDISGGNRILLSFTTEVYSELLSHPHWWGEIMEDLRKANITGCIIGPSEILLQIVTATIPYIKEKGEVYFHLGDIGDVHCCLSRDEKKYYLTQLSREHFMFFN